MQNFNEPMGGFFPRRAGGSAYSGRALRYVNTMPALTLKRPVDARSVDTLPVDGGKLRANGD